LQLLGEEPSVASEEVQAESRRESLPLASPEKKQRRAHPGRQTLPADLPRVERVISCTPEQCVCGGCGKETRVIGYEESAVLDVEPAKYFVAVTKREKRACKKCEEPGRQRYKPENSSHSQHAIVNRVLGRTDTEQRYAYLSKHVCYCHGDRVEACGKPTTSFGCAPAKRLSRYGIARPQRRFLRILYGFRTRPLSSRYGNLGGTLGRCRDLCCGSLLRKLVSPTLVESEDFALAWLPICRGGAAIGIGCAEPTLFEPLTRAVGIV
jgi:zinc-finger binding domain of transposase IS66